MPKTWGALPIWRAPCKRRRQSYPCASSPTNWLGKRPRGKGDVIDGSFEDKRILAISNHGVMLGGGEHSFFDLVRNLTKQCRLLTIVPEKEELGRKLTELGIETHVIPLPSIRPWSIAGIVLSLGAYLRICRRRRPHLIYANGSRAALYSGLAGKILGIPLVWHCRIAMPDPLLDRLLARLSTTIVVNSQAAAQRFQNLFPSKVTVVYNGINVEWLRSGTLQEPIPAPRTRKVILVVARVSRSKRHDLVLSSFERVAREDRNAHLVCIGGKDPSDPGWWAHLQSITSRSPFADRIHWVGTVDDLRPWYGASLVLVFPAENESFGRVIVEAMACGVPIIAAKSGGIPEIVREGQEGVLVTPGEAGELGDALISMLGDEKSRIQFAKAAFQRAEHFSLDNHLLEMVRLFKERISERWDRT